MAIQTPFRFSPGPGQITGRMKAAPGVLPTLNRSLTHPNQVSDWRAVMDSTRSQAKDFRTTERWNAVPVPERVAYRAITNVDKDPGGCWISRYSTGSHGYAQIGWVERGESGARKCRMVLAHRAAWASVHGQVPMGMTIDHVCKVRPCVNPSHLRLLPNYENARRNNGDDWPMGQCRNGHPNSELRVIRRRNKAGESREGLACGECMREYQRRYRAKRRQVNDDTPRTPRTQCGRGHELVDSNVYLRRNGERQCRICKREYAREYKRRKRLEQSMLRGDS